MFGMSAARIHIVAQRADLGNVVGTLSAFHRVVSVTLYRPSGGWQSSFRR